MKRITSSHVLGTDLVLLYPLYLLHSRRLQARVSRIVLQAHTHE